MDAALPALTVVADTSSLEALRHSWDELHAASTSPELVLDFRWLACWWKHYGEGRALAVGLFHDGRSLVGIAPCCRRRFSYRGLHFRRLEFMGSSEAEPDTVLSEYLGPIVRRGFEREVTAAFVQGVITDRFGPWDECVFEMMNGADPLAAILSDEFAKRGHVARVKTTMEAPYLPLPLDWKAYRDGLPKKRRYAITHAERKLADWAGKGGCMLRRASDARSLDLGFAILKALHAERWEVEGIPSVFASPRFHAFHREMAELLLASDQLELVWLEVGGAPVAAHYSFHANGRIYFYQSGRKMHLPREMNVGVAMLSLVLQDAIARRVREYDFLGGKSPYKTLFTKATRPLVRIRIAQPSGWERLRSILAQARGVLMRLTDAR